MFYFISLICHASLQFNQVSIKSIGHVLSAGYLHPLIHNMCLFKRCLYITDVLQILKQEQQNGASFPRSQCEVKSKLKE